MAKLLVLLVVFSASFYAPAQDITAEENCQLQLIDNAQPAPIQQLSKDSLSYLLLPAGQSRLRLSCTLDEQAVFTFGRDEIMNISWDENQAKVTPLSANSPSYLLPSGTFTVDFIFLTHHNYNQQFGWKSVATFVNESLLNNITMAAFYGLCLTLILYVFFMGRIVGDNRFQLYSLYVFCAATFFLLQEGQLNIILPQQSFLLSHQFYLLFAGLTVVTATIFIVRLTDLFLTWPRLTRYGLETSAFAVLIMSLVMLLLEHSELSAMIGSTMAYTTLILMLSIFALVTIQAYHNIKSARIVWLSLGLMVIAMLFRTVLSDMSPFLHRYALIFAFALEAFILAVAVTARIKNIRQDKLLAESQANTDVLCNVLNRRGWDKKANKMLSEQRTNGGAICLLYIDLNDFKQINDRWGHAIGDKVLKVVADIMRHQLRSKDCIGRVGGDEFVALGHFNLHNEAENLALRIKARLEHFNLQVDTHTNLELSASVGYVIFDTPALSLEQMLKKADESMYLVKNSKKQKELQFVEDNQAKFSSKTSL